MTDLPRVSIVVISHRPDQLPGAIASVLAQTYPNVELMVKHHRELWPSKFNEAWQGVSGKYLAFLPDDDRLDPTWTARCVEEVEKIQGDLAFTDYYAAKGGRRFEFRFPKWDGEILRIYDVPHFTFLVRTDLWRTLPDGTNGAPGGWDENQIRGYADWDSHIRMYRAHAKVAQISGEYLYSRGVQADAGSMLMTTADNDAALQLLRDKHSELARPRVAV